MTKYGLGYPPSATGLILLFENDSLLTLPDLVTVADDISHEPNSPIFVEFCKQIFTFYFVGSY